MKKILKILGVVILTLLVIAVVIAFIPIPLGENVKNEIRESVKSQTGRDLVINGGVSLQILPTLRVRAEDVKLANPDWAREQPFVGAQEIALNLDTWELLEGNYIVEGLSGENLDINFARRSENETSLSFQPTNQQASNSPESAKAIEGQGESRNILLQNVSFTTIQAQYSDYSSGMKVAGDINSLAVSLNFKNGNITVDGDADINSLIITTPQSNSSPRSDTAANPNASASSRVADLFPDDPLPALPVGQVIGTFDLNADLIQYNQFQLTNIRAGLAMQPDSASLTLDQFQFADGQGQGSVLVAPQQNQNVKMTVTAQYDNTSFQNVLRAFGSTSRANAEGGAVDLDMNLTGTGASLQQIMSTADGVFKFKVDSVRFEQDMFSFLGSDIVSLILPGSIRSVVLGQDNVMNCLVAGVGVQKGVGNVRAVSMDTKLMQVSGRGNVYLKPETLDVTLTPSYKQSGLMQYLNVINAVQVTGPILNPRISAIPLPVGIINQITESPENVVGAITGVLGGLREGKVKPKELLKPVIPEAEINPNLCQESLTAVGY